jgi:phage terminase large subunit-like protein
MLLDLPPLDPAALARLKGAALRQYVAVLDEAARRNARRRLYAIYPEAGPLRRELYPKHLEFFAAGAQHNERLFLAGNRLGKTLCASYEATCHLIGWYPPWWQGRRFDRPIHCWASGEDAKAVRESLQPMLMGPEDARGTGLIPGDAIMRSPARGGIPDALDFVQVKHLSGGASRLVFKAYEQGRKSFQAAQVDVMVFDEEPPQAIYSEGLTRTMSVVPGEPSGILMCVFTPLLGLSGVVLSYLPGGAMPATEAQRKAAWGWSILAAGILPLLGS